MDSLWCFAVLLVFFYFIFLDNINSPDLACELVLNAHVPSFVTEFSQAVNIVLFILPPLVVVYGPFKHSTAAQLRLSAPVQSISWQKGRVLIIPHRRSGHSKPTTVPSRSNQELVLKRLWSTTLRLPQDGSYIVKSWTCLLTLSKVFDHAGWKKECSLYLIAAPRNDSDDDSEDALTQPSFQSNRQLDAGGIQASFTLRIIPLCSTFFGRKSTIVFEIVCVFNRALKKKKLDKAWLAFCHSYFACFWNLCQIPV